MELSKNFEPTEIESRWTKHWNDKKYFNSTPDSRPAFTVVIPPPNVTGVLHMGHTLNETVQDILVRNARMSGYNACWVPGSDHASIATEARVVNMLKERGIDKNSLLRDEFLKYAFEWKEKYGGIIYHQIERLGCSVDWSRVHFTMDADYYKSVIKVFIDLYEKGKIYRGARMINWDPEAKTALSDEEVEYKEVQGKLYYVKYKLLPPDESSPSEEFITIATQRPETIMGDTAVCVNPNDERYKKYQGYQIIIPIVNRAVPIIFDEYVDAEFGTGALKVTPAHDINDYNLGLKHNLPIIDTLTADGKISEAAGAFVGIDRFEARKKVVESLSESGLLVKEEAYTTRVGFSQRTNAVVEPRISTQWFVRMKEFAQPALDEVVNGNIKIHPGNKFLATYKYWLENVKDWCISRQLWWGQRIPAWYDDKGNFVVAENEELAKIKFRLDYKNYDATLTQDEDVLDTWFSSWLWPIEVFKGISNPDNEDINYYYPTNVLVTGQDIIFFWVARMIMAGMEYKSTKPFSDVYFTGMVRDKLGRKMSKSLGNSPDLIQLIDNFGADAVRFGIMISSPAGNDLLFDESSCEQGKMFNNKVWNALKLVKIWSGRVAEDGENTSENFAIAWFENRLNNVKAEIKNCITEFKLSEALKLIYTLVWDDFCSWYLEWAKPGFEQPIQKGVYEKTVYFFEELMHILHPFMPFITEEVYHLLSEKEHDLTIKQYSDLSPINETIISQGALLQKLITAIRDAKVKNNIKPKEEIKLYLQTEQPELFELIKPILAKQTNATEFNFVTEPQANSLALIIDSHKCFIATNVELDTESQKAVLQKELEYHQGFLDSVVKKLSNERFMQNAKPEIIALEQKKKADVEAKIKSIEEGIQNLG